MPRLSRAALSLTPNLAAAAAAAPPPRTPCQRASVAALGVVYALVLAMICAVSWQLAMGADKAQIAWAIAGFFVAVTVPLSLHDVNMHLLHFVSPLQRFYVRILLLVPLYAIESWFSLRYDAQSIYISTIRDLYEPFVIHSFYQLMVQFLGSRDALAAKLIAEKGAFANISMFPYGLEFLRPYSCAPPDRGGRLWFLFWRNGETFIYRTQVGVYQYIIIKALMTVLFFITSLTNTLGSSSDYTAFVRDRRGRAASTHPRPTTTTTTTHPTRAGPAFVRSYPSCPHS